jgi:thymus-specific serine protease
MGHGEVALTCGFPGISFEFILQRYYSNDVHYIPGGPIFIYIGAGYEVYGNYLDSGLVYDLAREVGGYMFATESRFYGESRPTG